MAFPKEYKILIGIGIGAILLAWLLFSFGKNDLNQAGPLVDRSDAYVKGSQMATVTITEFSDFQCPACQTAQKTVDRIMSEYNGRVKLIFRHFPLDIHPLAKIAAEASEAAGKQGKFWEMHDLIYQGQAEWGDPAKRLSEDQAKEIFKKYAAELKLDLTLFNQALSDRLYSEVVSKDYNAGLAAGVRATPTFFVNGQAIKSPSYDAIKQGIEEALK